MPSASDPTLDDDTPGMVGSIMLIDADDEPAREAEIPDDPNRWTLPEIREASALALLALVTAPVLFTALGASQVKRVCEEVATGKE